MAKSKTSGGVVATKTTEQTLAAYGYRRDAKPAGNAAVSDKFAADNPSVSDKHAPDPGGAVSKNFGPSPKPIP